MDRFWGFLLIFSSGLAVQTLPWLEEMENARRILGGKPNLQDQGWQQTL